MRERALALRRRRLLLLLELEMSKMADEKVMGAPANGGAEDGMLAGGELSSAETRVRPLETLLRAAPLGLCVAAMAVMLRDTQTNEYGTVSYSDLGGFKYVAPYSVLPLPPCSRIGSCRVLTPFGNLAQNRRYLVYANGLCAAYSLVSAFYTAVPRPATLARSWIVFLLDQVNL